MKLLEEATAEHLLDESMERLFEEATEWLEIIEFWHAELNFLFQIVKRQTNNRAGAVANVEHDLTSDYLKKMAEMRNSVARHRNSVAEIIVGASCSDEEKWRRGHHEVKETMSKLALQTRELKNRIFSLVAD